MFGKSVRLFSLFGFTVRVDWSWLIILTLIVWSLAGGVFPNWYPQLEWTTHLYMALAAALCFFASIIVHELCHSLVARRYGLPMEGITLFVFGGVAEMHDQPPSPKAELLMALAGPASSLVICGAMLGIWQLGLQMGWPDVAVGVALWIGVINGILVAFNLIPGFPLDGGRVLRAILWKTKGDLRTATQAASKVGRAFGAVLIALGVLQIFLAGNPIGGVWWILIGLFVRYAAKSGLQQVLIRKALSGEKVRRFMNTEPVTVPAGTSVRDVVEDYVYEHHYKMFPVVSDGRLTGCVTTRQIKQVPREQWPETKVEALTDGCSDENAIAPDADAIEAFEKMSRHNNSRLVVVSDSKLEGILALKDLLKFLSLKLELEGDQPGTPAGLPDPDEIRRQAERA
jgi:Zn-dependent protease